MVTLTLMSKTTITYAQHVVKEHHYLHTPVDARCSVEGYSVHNGLHSIGLLLFGRPEATRCADWYGSVDDVLARRCEIARGCEVTRWQVLNLARVYLEPMYQQGGKYYSPDYLPGFTDRHGLFRSTLASTILLAAVERIGADYLMRRTPCFLDEPYAIRWLLSYCDTRLHKGTIYREAGFELYRTNQNGIQTWRIRLPELTIEQHNAIRQASLVNARSNKYRAMRSQTMFAF